MNKSRLITVAMLTIPTCVGQSAVAQPSCEKTFQPLSGDEGDWEDDDNWDPSGRPTSTDVACIPEGKTALINPEDTAVAEAIWVKSSGATLGRIEMAGDNLQPTSLKLFGDSRVDGTLMLLSAPKLIIDGQVTIDGTGQILLVPEASTEYPTIEGSGTFPELTLEGKYAGSWTPDDWDDRTDTLVLYGGGLIDVALVNQAHVSTWEEETLNGSYGVDATLTINQTSEGDGFWIAELDTGGDRTDVGTLDIKDTVTGSGTWVVATDDTAEIRINAALSSITGDVLVYDGTFLVRENFETTGDLTLEDQGKPAVVVRQGKTAEFSAP